MENKTILEKIRYEIQKFQEKKEELLKELWKEFPSLLTPLLEQSEMIESIGFTGFIPYFNDGEECIYSVNLDYMYINGENEDDYENDNNNFWDETVYTKMKNEDDIALDKELQLKKCSNYYPTKIGESGYKRNSYFNEKEANILANIKEVLNEIPNEFYRDLFGDHSMITIHKDGTIDVEEYDHD